MAAPHMNRKARGRLATNDNETIVVAGELDTEAHRLAANENETVVAAAKDDDDTVSTDEPDTEAHRLAANENETVVAAKNDDEATERGSAARGRWQGAAHGSRRGPPLATRRIAQGSGTARRRARRGPSSDDGAPPGFSRSHPRACRRCDRCRRGR